MSYEIDGINSTIVFLAKHQNDIITILEKYSKNNSKNITELFRDLRYHISISDINNIYIKDVVRQFKLHYDEEEFWSNLAPYILHGGYIIWYGEDGKIWRYLFKNSNMEIEHAHEEILSNFSYIINKLKLLGDADVNQIIKNIEWVV